MKPQPIGLVCAGGINQSWVAKLPRLLERLGPVKASGIRVASRIVNAFHAGRAVESYEALNCCSMIFVAVPPANFSQILDELLCAQIQWHGKTLVILDSGLDSQDLVSFQLRHAEIATLDVIDSPTDLRLVVQGNARTVKALRRLVEDGRTRIFEVKRGAKAACLAGLTIAASLAAPMLAASVECLMAAGFDLPQAQSVADGALSRARRAYLKAGKKGWVGSLAERDLKAVRRQWESLRRSNSDLAEYFLENTTSAVEYLSSDSNWIGELSQMKRRRREHESLPSAAGDR